MGAANAPARRLVAIRSALRTLGHRFAQYGLGAARRPYGAPHAQPVKVPAGFPDSTPETAAGPGCDCSRQGFRRRGRRSPPAATGAGSETPPLGRKGGAEDNGGCVSGDNRGGYARWVTQGGIAKGVFRRTGAVDVAETAEYASLFRPTLANSGS